MAKITRVIALALVIALACLTLASCGGLSGKYEAKAWGTGTELEFKGNKVTMTFEIVGFSGDPIEGTYKIDGDKISFDFTNEDYDDVVNNMLEKFQGELSYEKGDDYIKIAGVKYTKVD